MKKIALVAAIALGGVILLPSCKKDYTCVCTYDDGTGNIQTSSTPLQNTTKKKAKTACDDLTSQMQGVINGHCELK